MSNSFRNDKETPSECSRLCAHLLKKAGRPRCSKAALEGLLGCKSHKNSQNITRRFGRTEYVADIDDEMDVDELEVVEDRTRVSRQEPIVQRAAPIIPSGDENEDMFETVERDSLRVSTPSSSPLQSSRSTFSKEPIIRRAPIIPSSSESDSMDSVRVSRPPSSPRASIRSPPRSQSPVIRPRSSRFSQGPSMNRQSIRSQSPTQSMRSQSPTQSMRSQSPTQSMRSQSPTQSMRSQPVAQSTRSQSPTQSTRSQSPTQSTRSQSPTQSMRSQPVAQSMRSQSPTQSMRSQSPTQSMRSRPVAQPMRSLDKIFVGSENDTERSPVFAQRFSIGLIDNHLVFLNLDQDYKGSRINFTLKDGYIRGNVGHPGDQESSLKDMRYLVEFSDQPYSDVNNKSYGDSSRSIGASTDLSEGSYTSLGASSEYSSDESSAGSLDDFIVPSANTVNSLKSSVGPSRNLASTRPARSAQPLMFYGESDEDFEIPSVSSASIPEDYSEDEQTSESLLDETSPYESSRSYMSNRSGADMEIPQSSMRSMSNRSAADMEIPQSSMRSMSNRSGADMEIPQVSTRSMSNRSAADMEIPQSSMRSMSNRSAADTEIPQSSMRSMSNRSAADMEIPQSSMRSMSNRSAADMEIPQSSMRSMSNRSEQRSDSVERIRESEDQVVNFDINEDVFDVDDLEIDEVDIVDFDDVRDSNMGTMSGRLEEIEEDPVNLDQVYEQLGDYISGGSDDSELDFMAI